MANIYSSTIRTYMARNLIWNSQGSPVDLYALDSPNSIQLVEADMVNQFFRAGWPYGIDWYTAGNISIKRAGLFSNFADGLVFSNIKARLAFQISAKIFNRVESPGTMVFTKGSNIVTGTGWDSEPGPIGIGRGFRAFIYDNSNAPETVYPYALYDVSEEDGVWTGRLSDYSYQTGTHPTSFFVLQSARYFTYRPLLIPTLNTLYELEAFFNDGVPIVITATSPVVYVYGKLEIIGSSDTLDLYTKTIDTSFNELMASFDGVIEVEVTPYDTESTG